MAGLDEALATPHEVLECRSRLSDPVCGHERDLCCQCCNFGTITQISAGDVGCEINQLAFQGDCRRIFNYCCYNRGTYAAHDYRPFSCYIY